MKTVSKIIQPETILSGIAQHFYRTKQVRV